MKNGCIENLGAPDASELEAINKFTRRKFTADEVYAFSVVLCDNEVDRDFERFTDSALDKMAELFIGKTGIFDHSHKSENQCARIFFCKVEEIEGKLNRAGEPYRRLFARAYMPKSDKTRDLILEIDAGIKKEVSIGCSMSKAVCSVCGEIAGTCTHRKGRHYRQGGKKLLCYYELCEPSDAYEWSFVAVPAQPAAGVIKAFGKKDCVIELGEIVKSCADGEVTLTSDEARQLSEQIRGLCAAAVSAGEFIRSRKSDILKMFLPDAGEEQSELFMKALDRLEPEELYKLYDSGKRKGETAVSELAPRCGKKTDTGKNSLFMI